jgi:hypothetical protein
MFLDIILSAPIRVIRGQLLRMANGLHVLGAQNKRWAGNGDFDVIRLEWLLAAGGL